MPDGACTLLKTIAMSWRSRVGSPFTSMNWVACVTGSNTITNCAGSCTERMHFSPAGSSTESMTISRMISSNRASGRSMPELQKTCFW